MEFIFDTLYLLGLLFIWYGNIVQTIRVIKTKSTKSFSVAWVWALWASITIRLPRAVTSDYFVWQAGYLVSFILATTLLICVLWHKKRFPRR